MVIVFLEELNVSSVDHFQSDATLLEDSTERTADVEGGKTAPWQVHTHPLPSCPFLLLCSSLSPSLLFVLGTYQPERVKRRREGGGVIQHVRQGRGGKKRIACGAGTQRADGEVARTGLKNTSFFLFCFLLLFFGHLNQVVSIYVLLLLVRFSKLCWVPASRERRFKIGHPNGGMEEKAKWRRWKLSRWVIHQTGFHPLTPAADDIVAPSSLFLSPDPTLGVLTLYVKESGELTFTSRQGELCSVAEKPKLGCTFLDLRNRDWTGVGALRSCMKGRNVN